MDAGYLKSSQFFFFCCCRGPGGAHVSCFRAGKGHTRVFNTPQQSSGLFVEAAAASFMTYMCVCEGFCCEANRPNRGCDREDVEM